LLNIFHKRFKDIKSKISIINFTSPKDFLEWHSKYQTEFLPFLYLVDLEFLNYSKTGIKIIEECGIQQNSVLVTSHFDNTDIHTQCEQLGIKIIPKDLAVFVPINS
jgi:hypothetical protein